MYCEHHRGFPCVAVLKASWEENAESLMLIWSVISSLAVCVCVCCVCAWMYTVCVHWELMQLQFLFALPRWLKCWWTYGPKLTQAITLLLVRVSACAWHMYKRALIRGLMFCDWECYVVGRGRTHTYACTDTHCLRIVSSHSGAVAQKASYCKRIFISWVLKAELICTAGPLLLLQPESQEREIVSHPGTLISSLMFFLLNCWN